MKLHEAVVVTYAAIGQELSDAALKIICLDLEPYPIDGVMAALTRCRKECRGKLALADILDRIPGGHPGAEEAWAMCRKALGDERVTLIVTPAMRTAFFMAEELCGDEIAARMVFKEVYAREVSIARSQAAIPEWSVIQGTDKSTRDDALMRAVTDGRLTPQMAYPLLSHRDEPTSLGDLARLAPEGIRKQLENMTIKDFE